MLFSLIAYRRNKLNASSPIQEWERFSKDMGNYYNIDVGALEPAYKKEQEEYFLYSSLWTELKIEHVVGQAAEIKKLDLNTW